MEPGCQNRPMKIDVRIAREDEHDDFSRTFLTALLEKPPSPALLEKRLPGYLAMRVFGAYEGGEIVGTAGAWPFDMAVPGGARIGVAAVTAVGVLPTHTRRGALTGMMRATAHRCRRARPARRDPGRVRKRHLRPVRIRAGDHSREPEDSQAPHEFLLRGRRSGANPTRRAGEGARDAPRVVRPLRA